MASPETLSTNSELETFALGEKVAGTLEPGTFVLLHGDLGAGKTAFVRGLAAGLGANPDDVSSRHSSYPHYKGGAALHVTLRLDTAAAAMTWIEKLANGAG